LDNVAHKCNIHKNYKQNIITIRGTSTTVTGRAAGHPVRIIKNRLAKDFQQLEKRNASLKEYEELVKNLLYRAVREGDMCYIQIINIDRRLVMQGGKKIEK